MASRTIEVILKADVENLGHKYDIVRVRPGYAWNYLIPRGFAEVAGPGEGRRPAISSAASRTYFDYTCSGWKRREALWGYYTPANRRSLS